jgi:hypothetical protein
MSEQRKEFEKREEFFQAIVAAEVLGLAWRAENAEQAEPGMGAGEPIYVLWFRAKDPA